MRVYSAAWLARFIAIVKPFISQTIFWPVALLRRDGVRIVFMFDL
jgi:hypothetical protein